MIGIQDVFSRKLLAWRVDREETSELTRLAFADLFKKFGIPGHCLLDNGRAFAAGSISAGTPTRFRGKVRPEDGEGLLVSLGIKVHWAKPYHGQSKPVERYWRMACNLIATGPDFHGAYTGNSTSTKPHNYGERAIPLADFERVIAREIAAINAKIGRRTEMAALAGKGADSFDAVFAASIAAGAPVGRASEAHLRMALLGSERLFAHRDTGEVKFAGNRYWAADLSPYRGQWLTVRYDPENLHGSVFAYDESGKLIGEIPVLEAVGFHDMAGAKKQAALVSGVTKKSRELAKAEQLLEADAMARALADLGTPEAVEPEPSVIRPVRQSRRGSAAVAIQSTSDVTDFNARFLKASLRLVEK
jgi:hypothetical protein